MMETSDSALIELNLEEEADDQNIAQVYHYKLL